MKLEVDQKLVGKIPEQLVLDILELITDEDWFVTTYRNTAGNMYDTESIPLMHTELCASGLNTMKPIAEIKPEALYNKYKECLNKILAELSNYYEYDKYAAFIARLKPQGIIGKHKDHGNFLTLCHRVHIPLQTNLKVSYQIDDKEYYWEKGNIYEFDNTRVHGVVNKSDDYRIHLVVNLYPKGI